MITSKQNKDKYKYLRFFKEDENNPSNFENLGIARASYRRFLIERDCLLTRFLLSVKKIILLSQIKTIFFMGHMSLW